MQARFGASARLTDDFNRLPGTRHEICRCSRRPKERSSSRNDQESGKFRSHSHILALHSLTAEYMFDEVFGCG